MRSRVLIVGLVLVGAFAASTLVASAMATTARKSAVVRFLRPTQVAGALVLGQVVFVHDDERMARGEPCTTVYWYDAKKGHGDEIVSFMCNPTERVAAKTFTAECVRGGPTGPDRLIEFQFGGDTEGHGVPLGY